MNKEKRKEYQHVMIDIETLSLRADALVLSIGGVIINKKGENVKYSTKEGNYYYEVLPKLEQRCLGRDENPNTIQWWEEQNEKAREVLRESDYVTDTVEEILLRFNKWITSNKEITPIVWSNGNLDIKVLEDLYEIARVEIPWIYKHVLDYKTVRALKKEKEKERTNKRIEHNALNDAIEQAELLKTWISKEEIEKITENLK